MAGLYQQQVVSMRDGYSPIHLLNPQTVHPLCGSTESSTWNWTVSSAAVTCPKCLRLIRESASEGSEAGAAHPRE